MYIDQQNNPNSVFDHHITIRCPHCNIPTNITAVSIPRFELVKRFKLRRVGVAYRCNSCNEPVFLVFPVTNPAVHPIEIQERYREVEKATESFEFQYLPDAVAEDFREALICYSQSCWNAFASMCRRCIQTTSMVLGAEGSTKVQGQLLDLREMGVIDEEALEQLRTIMLSGHDGAHPHLPKLSPERAAVLLELMRDVLYQLFVRHAKIREAMALRAKATKGS
jgi:hypothetical protein